MKRLSCEHCHYPETTCICSAVKTIVCKTQFDILQHPSEVKVAKNTARICKLCIPTTNIWVGESPSDFANLTTQLQHDTRQIIVLYPTDEAIALESIVNTNNIKNIDEAIRVILIDGTWKKAFKIWKLNQWLNAYPKVLLTHFVSTYDIRKAPTENHLSTLEALTYSLNAIEPDVDTRALFNSFELMQSHFKRFSEIENKT